MQITGMQKEFVKILKKKTKKKQNKTKTREYHDLYVQSDALLLADVFERFRNMCLEIYEFDPAKFFSSLGLAWQAALKKTKVKLDHLTGIDMLLMIRKGIRGGMCHSIY